MPEHPASLPPSAVVAETLDEAARIAASTHSDYDCPGATAYEFVLGFLNVIESEARSQLRVELRAAVEGLRYRPEQRMDNEMELHNALLDTFLALISRSEG